MGLPFWRRGGQVVFLDCFLFLIQHTGGNNNFLAPLATQLPNLTRETKETPPNTKSNKTPSYSPIPVSNMNYLNRTETEKKAHTHARTHARTSPSCKRAGESRLRLPSPVRTAPLSLPSPLSSPSLVPHQVVERMVLSLVVQHHSQHHTGGDVARPRRRGLGGRLEPFRERALFRQLGAVAPGFPVFL